MSSQLRPIPPRAGRLGAAARAGLFGHSSLLTGGGAILGVTGAGLAFGEPLRHLLRDLMLWVALAPVSSVSMSEAMGKVRGAGLFALSLFCVSGLLTALLGALVPVMWSRRHRGATAVPLPEEPFALAARLVPRLMAGLALFFILTRAALSARRLLGEIDWELCLEEFAHLAGSTLLACGVVLFCAGVAEALLRNMCVRRALFLSPAEARREGRPSARRSLGEDSKGRTR